jgi:hypothetical protein
MPMRVYGLAMRSGIRLGRRHRRATSACCAAVGLLALVGCSSTGKTLARAAFVQAVNLECRSTRARVEIAGRLATVAAQTDQGRGLTADGQAKLDAAKGRAQDLVDRFAGIGGPSGLQESLVAGFRTLKDIPGQVSDGSLTPEEGKRRIDATRADLRANGFVDCV